MNSFENRFETTPSLGTIPTMTRRSLLAAVGIGGAALATGCSSGSGSNTNTGSGSGSGTESSPRSDTGSGPAAETPASSQAAKPSGRASTKRGAADGRVLVVVELSGGMDGFATLVPYGTPTFRKLRERIWIDPNDLEVIDETYAVPKGLAVVKDRLAFVEGIGVSNPNLSHFDMMRRWWLGDLDGTSNVATGFLGRCCDHLANGEPITGLSVGGGSTPALLSESAATVALPALELVRGIAKSEPSEDRLRKTLRLGASERNGVELGAGSEADRLAAIARGNLGNGLDLLRHFERLDDGVDKRYPEGNQLAGSFASVKQLISLNAGMQVFHIPWGSFDTHADQVGNHSAQMEQFGAALAAFLDDVQDSGLGDRVLVATTSEFGRRAEASGSGTDHGTTSTMMLAGAVKVGRHGQAPNFAKRDADGNVIATTALGDYYATLATWMGIDPSEVLGNGTTTIDTLLH